MDSHVGLDFIVDNPDYCHKLASALDTTNVRVKKQVVELLSALCVYSQDGRQRAIDTLDIYQNRKEARYRLLVVVNELGQAHDSEDYQTALLAFINCLVISAPGLKDRVRMRNEFIGLKLLPILNELRKEKNHVPELRVQLDVFDDQRDTDEVLANQGPPGIDLSSHVDVFYAILGQVADTPQEIAFLSLLQHLLRLDPKEPASDLAWDTAETLVHRATLLESREDATKLLRSPSLQTNLCCHCRTTDQMCGGGSSGLGVAASGGGNTTATASVSNPASSGRKAPSSPASLVPPPPPPPPAPLLQPKLVLPPPPPLPNFSVTPAAAAPPPPPPPKMMMSMGGGGVGGSMGSGGNGGPPAPPPFMVPNNRLRTERLQLEPEVSKAPSPEPPNDAKLLPQQEIPTPRTKMKTINWNKIPNHKVIGKHNIWSVVANEHQNSPMPDLDWAEIESLFCQTSAATSANLTGFNNNTEVGKSRRESTEITLLHGKRSLNINIFLKQFRSLNMLITDLISDGAHDIVGGERLRGLLKILPEVDELEMLNNFQGDRTRLGPAEKFYLDLQQVPNYKLRIECMLLKEEFGLNLRYLKTNLSSMIQVGRNLMTNKPLQEVLYMVLIAGNFLNSGGYAGNAAGVKLSSLQKLTEIRANKPGMNLIHYVAMQAEKKNKDLLNFTQEMSDLETATKTTIEQVTNEFNALDSRIKKICSQIQLPTTEKDIQDQMAKFLEMSERELEQIKLDIDELDNVRRSLAEFFCEDANTFKVEECFKIFHQFCQKFTQAVADNKHRKLMEEQALARKKQRDEQGSTKKRIQADLMDIIDSDNYGLDFSSLENGIPQKSAKMKKLQTNGLAGASEEDITIGAGSPSLRRRLGSISGGPDLANTKDDSPDITPNGTLRRRRSRVVPCDEDNNLMDFLRSNGQDNSRERKFWGSLDRSWAKKARGTPRRSDLLNADFSGDRERASSPSPLAEQKQFVQQQQQEPELENSKVPRGKHWRQKIEAWLIENEKKDKDDELQLKVNQRQSSRRNFEETENEGKNALPRKYSEDLSLGPEKHRKLDWQPSVEKTDVMRTMEAIEEAQPAPQTAAATPKDKSPWRKSSLNVSNPEDADLRYSRRHRSGTLQAIREEERKKNSTNSGGTSSSSSTTKANDGLDEMTIYLRTPTTPSGRRLVQVQKLDDKLDIDSADNAETTLGGGGSSRSFKDATTTSAAAIPAEKSSTPSDPGSSSNNAYADLGSGNFDRFSAARRTRRYKKGQDPPQHDNASVKLDFAMDDSESVNSSSTPARRPSTLSLSSADNNSGSSSEAMLKAWQDKLKHHHHSQRNGQHEIDAARAEIAKSGEDLQQLSTAIGSHRNTSSRLPISQPAPVLAVTNTVLSPVMQESRPRDPMCIVPERATPSRERRRSMIDPSQVKESLRFMNEPELITSSTNENLPPNSQLAMQSSTEENLDMSTESEPKSPLFGKTNSQSRFIPDLTTTNKAREQELNDEGFEETQSLVSETLSQEASSGNYETDTHDSTRCSPAEMTRGGDTPKKSNPKLSTLPKVTQLAKSSSGSGSTGSTSKAAASSAAAFSRRDSSSRLAKAAAQDKTVGRLKQAFERRNSRDSVTSTRSSSSASKAIPADKGAIGNSTSYLPKRAASLKREPPTRMGSLDNPKRALSTSLRNHDPVERSASRSSLRSSRSSLNSSTSVNTVRNNKKHIASATTASKGPHLDRFSRPIRALAGDLARKNSAESNSSVDEKMTANNGTGVRRVATLRNSVSTTKIPASRSSSSGSSVGPAAKMIRKAVPTSSNASRESASNVRRRNVPSATQQPTTGLLTNNKSAPSATTSKVSSVVARLTAPRGSSTGTQRSQSFMRPTAASVNKNTIAPLPKGIKTLVK
ncbi:hypothetical protein TKK_0014411 [Trichogramma kaykai]|uniref:FH2 domain-containing protein n=1 Tax=Trichogramma kaykai TaxID=54128 RepID=A0ABD2WD63_9HYME